MKYIIITHPAGQLGNRILQTANIMLYAERQGAKLINPGFDLYGYAQYFPFFHNQVLCTYPHRGSSGPSIPNLIRLFFLKLIKTLINLKLFKYSFYHNGRVSLGKGILPAKWAYYLVLGTDEVCNLEETNSVFLNNSLDTQVLLLCGWEYRLADLFDTNASKIREIFTPFEKYMDHAESITKKARGSASILVGVHIRWGDYKTHKGGRFYYDIDVYQKKIQQMRELFKESSVRFLMCSNENIQHLFEGDSDISFGSGHIIEDMYAFAKCDFILGPPSTYTAWASFYGETPLFVIENPNQELAIKDFYVYKQNNFLLLDKMLK